jgi:hypothetical protein
MGITYFGQLLPKIALCQLSSTTALCWLLQQLPGRLYCLTAWQERPWRRRGGATCRRSGSGTTTPPRPRTTLSCHATAARCSTGGTCRSRTPAATSGSGTRRPLASLGKTRRPAAGGGMAAVTTPAEKLRYDNGGKGARARASDRGAVARTPVKGGGGRRVVRPVDKDLYQVPPPDFTSGRPRRVRDTGDRLPESS